MSVLWEIYGRSIKLFVLILFGGFLVLVGGCDGLNRLRGGMPEEEERPSTFKWEPLPEDI